VADVKEFLNPHSMLTPGLAGGLTVSISMPIALTFDLSVKWLALTVSLLLGLAIILSVPDPLSRLQRFVYYILNSLIIFSTALGAGINIDAPPEPPALPLVLDTKPRIGSLRIPHMLLGVSDAFAEDHSNPSPSFVEPEIIDKALEEKKWAGMDLSMEQLKILRAYQLRQQEYEEQRIKHDKRWSW
jgi:hypothetical protein